MSPREVVLAPCAHGGEASGADCLACDGTGWVKVVPGPDGEPRECEHASARHGVEDCVACLGSGWAGVVA